MSVTYSGQFLDVCKSLDADALVISSCRQNGTVKDGPFELKHVPRLFPNARGLFYHIAEILYGIRLMAAAVHFRADYVVVADGSTHWFALCLLPSRRYRTIATVHCMLWLPFKPASSLVRRMNKRFFRRHAHAVMSASEEITKQIVQTARGEPRPIAGFLPTYRRGTFSRDASPPGTPFKVLFAGRVEADKGVFDLLDIARTFVVSPERKIEFDVCGEGSALARLRSDVEAAGLAGVFRCHGHCSRAIMRQMFAQCHAVAVPTTTSFGEGFNQVLIEAVLAGRPVITSAVCPALSYVREAVVEVPPDNSAAYAKAIIQLCDDPGFYEQKRRACSSYQEQFYDESKGWAAALQSIISAGETR